MLHEQQELLKKNFEDEVSKMEMDMEAALMEQHTALLRQGLFYDSVCVRVCVCVCVFVFTHCWSLCIQEFSKCWDGQLQYCLVGLEIPAQQSSQK